MDVMPEEEIPTLDDLESRILRAVELVTKLRKEKESAVREAALAKAEAAEARQELDSLRSERKQVRTRIEKLLGQMDLLGTG